MTRVEITIGFLSLLGVIAITAAVGIGEGVKEGDNGRLAKAALGFEKRSVESGAQMFDQYCANCHAFNAAGANCPPLDETSGLHGGDLGEGVAWRLEEMHWDRADVYGYVYSTIAAGRMESSRPDRYQGLDPKIMAMPAWSQQYGGPLRPDQMKDLANYVVNFRAYLPSAKEEAAYEKGCRQVMEIMNPSRPQYVSKCYEKLCVVAYEAKGKTPPTMPEAPPKPADGQEKDPAYVAAKAQYDANLTRYWASFWSGCKAAGGQAPPDPITATPSPAVAAGTPGGTGEATVAGDAGTAEAPAGTGTPATPATAAAGGGATATATKKP